MNMNNQLVLRQALLHDANLPENRPIKAEIRKRGKLLARAYLENLSVEYIRELKQLGYTIVI